MATPTSWRYLQGEHSGQAGQLCRRVFHRHLVGLSYEILRNYSPRARTVWQTRHLLRDSLLSSLVRTTSYI